MSSGQSSPATEQPPIFWQIDAPDGCAAQRPLQQSPAESQVSPSTRQPPSGAQRILPIAPRHCVVQQSLLPAQLSPDGRQPPAGSAHLLPLQTEPQHSTALLHVVVAGEQSPAWQVALIGSQSSEQHAPARSHG